MRLAQAPEPPPDPSTSGVASAHGSPLDQHVIESVRAGVEERTWEAFWRVVIDGKEAAVVAQELGISVQAVHNAKYRVRRRLQQETDRTPE
jgi:RNA polymerase sigma-70 factor (ECF subfamily)